jgi:superfamily II DNA or RNA helicase
MAGNGLWPASCLDMRERVAVASLESLIGGLDPDEYRRGKQFERIVEWFLTHAPEYQTQLRRVWLWDDWPDRPSQDLGIDLVAEAHSGGVWAIQAKAYASEYSVTKRDMDSFLAASASRRFSYRLLVATTDRIAANARKTMEQQAIPVGMLLRSDLASSGLNWPASPSRLVAHKAPKKRLRADQREAVRDVLAGFKLSERGQMIRACGTGKTLTALRVHEQLQAKRTLVLVPSLSLLSQTLRDWTANVKEPFEYLAVCSDETVADPDAPVASTHDLGIPVTTDANEVGAFLHRRGQRVIFSTYQSSPQVASAYRKHHKPPAFDLAICDEAHRCAGPASSAFATILDAKKIRAKRRLFMTATPRYFTGRIIREAKEAEFEIASMDDEATFGPVFHRLTFAQAIERDLLSDYQVVIVGVDDATYRAWAEHGKYVTRDGTKITDARTLAGQIGLAKAMRAFDLRRVITFHSRVDMARRFSSEFASVIAWMPSSQRPTGRIQADYVSGEMPTGERRRRLSRLANPQVRERALLSNARCLAEGVDVPTLDGVAFLDPRRSEVDIVQAVGRAIRKAPDKSVGTIVLPVFIGEGDDAETVLEGSPFQPIWHVMKALRAHDEELADQLDAIRRDLGRQSRPGKRLPSKIKVILPAKLSPDFARAFDARLVEQTTAGWEFWFGLLEEFAAREGHASPVSDWRENGYRLGQWVNVQGVRHRANELELDRELKLSVLRGWRWAPFTEKWDEGLAVLKHHVTKTGHARVGESEVFDGFPIGRWVAVQRSVYRSRSRELSPDRVKELESLPDWTWKPMDSAWEDGFSSLNGFAVREGHSRVPRHHEEHGFRLGHWVSAQRVAHRGGRLSTERAQRLEGLPGWSWEPSEALWERSFEKLESFAQRTGDASPRQSPKSDSDLARWVSLQRHRYREGTLDPVEIQRLETLPGWSWDQRVAFWNSAFEALTRFVERVGTARVPSDHVEDDLKLGSWVAAQRVAHRRGTLSSERAALLTSVPGWHWQVNAERWEASFEILRVFVEREGDARVPTDYTEAGLKLGQWVAVQRRSRRQGRLSADQIARLDALPDWSWNLSIRSRTDRTSVEQRDRRPARDRPRDTGRL